MLFRSLAVGKLNVVTELEVVDYAPVRIFGNITVCDALVGIIGTVVGLGLALDAVIDYLACAVIQKKRYGNHIRHPLIGHAACKYRIELLGKIIACHYQGHIGTRILIRNRCGCFRFLAGFSLCGLLFCFRRCGGLCVSAGLPAGTESEHCSEQHRRDLSLLHNFILLSNMYCLPFGRQHTGQSHGKRRGLPPLNPCIVTYTFFYYKSCLFSLNDTLSCGKLMLTSSF